MNLDQLVIGHEQAALQLAELKRRLQEAQELGPRIMCEALRKWRDLLPESKFDMRAIDYTFHCITKSDLLDRMVYRGQEPRTKKCPTHNGVWQGLPDGRHDCACGLTGWLP